MFMYNYSRFVFGLLWFFFLATHQRLTKAPAPRIHVAVALLARCIVWHLCAVNTAALMEKHSSCCSAPCAHFPPQLELGCLKTASVFVVSGQCCMWGEDWSSYSAVLSSLPALQTPFNPALESISPRCNYFTLRFEALTWFSCLTEALRRLILSPPTVLDVSLKVFALKVSLLSSTDERHKSHLVSPLCFNILPPVFEHIRSRHDKVAGLKGWSFSSSYD